MRCYRHHTLNRRTTFPFVSGYNAVGDDVEDGKQEEANLKNEKKKLFNDAANDQHLF